MRFRIFHLDNSGSDERGEGYREHHHSHCGHQGHHHGHHRGRPDEMGEGAFGHRGGPGRFGGGWRARRGEARYILLDVLNDGPKHGYEIIKTLEERTGGEWAPSPGTVYPTLQFLEDLGLIQAVQDGERKAFNLTDKGREELASRQEELQAFWARFAPNQEVSSSEVGYIRDEVETLIKTLRRGLHHSGKTLDQETLKKIRGVIEGAREEVRKLLSD